MTVSLYKASLSNRLTVTFVICFVHQVDSWNLKWGLHNMPCTD